MSTNPEKGPASSTATLLAAHPRGDHRELRIYDSTLDGHRFLRLQVWQTNDAVSWPLKGKGVTIRMHELPTLMAALGRLLESVAPRLSEAVEL